MPPPSHQCPTVVSEMGKLLLLVSNTVIAAMAVCCSGAFPFSLSLGHVGEVKICPWVEPQSPARQPPHLFLIKLIICQYLRTSFSSQLSSGRLPHDWEPRCASFLQVPEFKAIVCLLPLTCPPSNKQFHSGLCHF